MANAVLLHVTIDHQVIFSWAQRTGARPSTFEGNERRWPLFFDFGPPSSGHEEISWDRFFTEFERGNLAFVYRDTGPNMAQDDLHEFIKRAAVMELVMSGLSTITEQAI